MSAYLSTAEFVERYTEREARLLTDEANTGAVNTVRLESGLVDACGQVDGYLSRRYTVPLRLASTGALFVPEMVKRITGDIARYLLTGTHVRETDAIRNRYRDAIKLLESIADGQVALGADLQPATGNSTPPGGATAVLSGDRLFGDDVLSQLI